MEEIGRVGDFGIKNSDPLIDFDGAVPAAEALALMLAF
jgi:hypothetical protein